ncbi:MAG: ATPase, T2SS/T4P/T4SS family, partial [Anaerolineaceae bacterium]
MAENQEDQPSRTDSNQAFGWSNVRRRLGGGDATARAVDGPEDSGTPSDDRPRLRPSGQFGTAATPRRSWGHGDEPAPPPAPPAAEDSQRPTLLRAVPAQTSPGAPHKNEPAVARRRPTEAAGSRANPQAEAAKLRLHELLIDELEHGALENLAPEQQREAVIRAARELITQEGLQLGGTSREELLEAVADEALGLGPLEPLLRDPAVTEVMVNDLDKIYYEQEGRIFRSPARFRDKQHIMRIIERIVAPLGRRIDESSPMVDARLPDGSRVNITVPPASPKSPTIT